MKDSEKTKSLNNFLIIAGMLIILFLLFLVSHDIVSLKDLKSKYISIKDSGLNIKRFIRGAEKCKFGLIQKWSVKIPSVMLNKCIAISRDGKKLVVTAREGKIYIINTRTGKIENTTKTIKNILSPVYFHKDLFLIPARNGVFQTLDLEGSKKIFISPGAESGKILDTPALVDMNRDIIPDIIFGDSSMNIYCYNGKSGTKLWKSPDALGSINISPVTLKINRDRIPDIITAADNGWLLAIDGYSGWVLWKINTVNPAKFKIIITDIDNDRKKDIILTTSNNEIWAIKKNREILWKLKVEGKIESDPVIEDIDGDGFPDITLIKNGKLILIDSISKKLKWEFKPKKSRISSDIGLIKNRKRFDLSVSDTSGTLYIINGKTGRIITLSRVDSKIYAGPYIEYVDSDSNPEIILLTEKRSLYFFTYNKYRRKILTEILPFSR